MESDNVMGDSEDPGLNGNSEEVDGLSLGDYSLGSEFTADMLSAEEIELIRCISSGTADASIDTSDYLIDWKANDIDASVIKRYAYRGGGVTQEQYDYLTNTDTGRHDLEVMRNNLWHSEHTPVMCLQILRGVCGLREAILSRCLDESGELTRNSSSGDYDSDTLADLTVIADDLQEELHKSVRRYYGQEMYKEVMAEAEEHLELDGCTACRAMCERLVSDAILSLVHSGIGHSAPDGEGTMKGMMRAAASAVAVLPSPEIRPSVDLEFANTAYHGSISTYSIPQGDQVVLWIRSEEILAPGDVVRLSLISSRGHVIKDLYLAPRANDDGWSGGAVVGNLTAIMEESIVEFGIVVTYIGQVLIPSHEVRSLEASARWNLQYAMTDTISYDAPKVVALEIARSEDAIPEAKRPPAAPK